MNAFQNYLCSVSHERGGVKYISCFVKDFRKPILRDRQMLWSCDLRNLGGDAHL